MKRFAMGAVLGLGVFVSAPSALAQPARDMAGRGHFILSAERVLPLFAYTNDKTSPDSNNSTSTSNTSLSLMSFGPRDDIAYNVPRVALDYTVIDGLTLGGSIFVYFDMSRSTTQTEQGRSVSGDQPKLTAFGFAPRVGYILPLADTFAFWPRGGFSYFSVSESNPNNNVNTSSFHQLGIDLEPMFVFAPVDHFGIVFGPAVDIPLSGSVDETNRGVTTSVDHSQFHFGITAGLLGYFGGS